MKKHEIETGKTYQAKVNGQITTVRVDRIYPFGATATHYDLTNLRTGRKTTFRSAQKFIRPAHADPIADQIKNGGDRQPTLTENSDVSETKTAVAPRSQGSRKGVQSGTAPIRAEQLANGQTGNGVAATAGGKGSAISGILRQSIAENEQRKAAAKRQPKFQKPPTPEQQALLDIVNTGIDRLMVEAGAGTGKTTSLRMLVEVLPGVGQYTAFNSSLVAESKVKFQGTNCSCNTTHSLAFRAEGKRFAHRLNSQRVRAEQVAKMLGIGPLEIPMGDQHKTLAPGFLASHVSGAVRRFCQSAEAEIDASHFRYIDGIDLPAEDGRRTYKNNERVREYLLPFARKAWDDLSNPEGQLPFSHDHYVKVWQLNHPVISADYILLDEAQDTAPVMLDILRQQKALVILVGDSAQQIYEWRGAVNALAAFPDAPRRMLSQSFRFGEAIAEVANAILETLDESTPLRLKGLPSIPSRIAPIEEPTAILCRTNAAAVAYLLGSIAEGKRPFLVGGGSDVIAFVEAAEKLQQGQPVSHPDLACFSSWVEVQEYVKLDEGEDLKLMVKLIDEFGATTIVNALKSMPREQDADLVISTAHKSKGREWDHVKLAADFPTQSKSGDADRKLLYVSATRAKLTLDISQCPFFTGQDALDVSHVISSQPKPEDTGVVPPAPSTPPAPEEFTWSKRDGAWMVRGPVGKSGETVDVVRKDGSKSKRTLGKVSWENETVAIYQV